MPPKKPVTPQTTAQQLGAIIKSARNIMRKDKGLNGDLDRLPMLTWIMFLKFLDDMEQLRETNHFAASAEMHTLSRLYETLLREMRDAAGDSGEFYTSAARKTAAS